MSKYVKNLVAEHLRDRLKNNQRRPAGEYGRTGGQHKHAVAGDSARKEYPGGGDQEQLGGAGCRRDAAGAVVRGLSGTAAVCWGCEDIVSLSKEITKLVKGDKFKPFEARGGVMDGECLSAADVERVSKWPSRSEQLSILLGQILSPGANLASQLNSVGGALASQIEQRGGEEEKEEEKGEKNEEIVGEQIAGEQIAN